MHFRLTKANIKVQWAGLDWILAGGDPELASLCTLTLIPENRLSEGVCLSGGGGGGGEHRVVDVFSPQKPPPPTRGVCRLAHLGRPAQKPQRECLRAKRLHY